MFSDALTIPQSGDEQQFQRTKSDIKNVIPLDLYEGMNKAAAIRSAMMRQNTQIPESKFIQFYEIFYATYKITWKKITPDLSGAIIVWFRNVRLPVRDRVIYQEGIKLFGKFHDELVDLGILSMFEDPITPPIGNLLPSLDEL